MATVRRLANSCMLVTDATGTTLLDPGFFTFEHVDLATIGDVQRVLITHEHRDHVQPEFVRWLLDRGGDVTVASNQTVADLLAAYDIEVTVEPPPGTAAEDGLHEELPNGAQPPNRAWTVGSLVTHPGDSYQATATAPVLALPLITPWGTMRKSILFAQRLAPRQVFPIHDFYLSETGRRFAIELATSVLNGVGIEMVPLDWGDAYTV